MHHVSKDATVLINCWAKVLLRIHRQVFVYSRLFGLLSSANFKVYCCSDVVSAAVAALLFFSFYSFSPLFVLREVCWIPNCRSEKCLVVISQRSLKCVSGGQDSGSRCWYSVAYMRWQASFVIQWILFKLRCVPCVCMFFARATYFSVTIHHNTSFGPFWLVLSFSIFIHSFFVIWNSVDDARKHDECIHIKTTSNLVFVINLVSVLLPSAWPVFLSLQQCAFFSAKNKTHHNCLLWLLVLICMQRIPITFVQALVFCVHS